MDTLEPRGAVARTESDDRTRVAASNGDDLDPVVGWLVCTEGPGRGHDYRIRSGRNTVGRSSSMDVAITDDMAISRDSRAIVRFDPRAQSFRMLAGSGRGLVYANDVIVDLAVDLEPFDVISLGHTKLLFVPLCGARFGWTSTPVDPGSTHDEHVSAAD